MSDTLYFSIDNPNSFYPIFKDHSVIQIETTRRTTSWIMTQIMSAQKFDNVVYIMNLDPEQFSELEEFSPLAFRISDFRGEKELHFKHRSLFKYACENFLSVKAGANEIIFKNANGGKLIMETKNWEGYEVKDIKLAKVDDLVLEALAKEVGAALGYQVGQNDQRTIFFKTDDLSQKIVITSETIDKLLCDGYKANDEKVIAFVKAKKLVETITFSKKK